MKRSIKSFVLSAIVLFAVSQAQAEMIRWDGTGSPSAVGYRGPNTNSPNGTGFSYDTPVAGFMHQAPRTDGYDSFDYTNETGDPIPLTRSNGWLVEFGIEVLSTPQEPWGAYVGVGDDDGNVYVSILTDSISVGTGGVRYPDIYVGPGYHTYIVRMPPDGTYASIYVDGGSFPIAAYEISNLYPLQGVQFGDGATNVGAAEAIWDFVHVNDTQVPEPSTFALAAFGLIGLGWFGWRRWK